MASQLPLKKTVCVLATPGESESFELDEVDERASGLLLRDGQLTGSWHPAPQDFSDGRPTAIFKKVAGKSILYFNLPKKEVEDFEEEKYNERKSFLACIHQNFSSGMTDAQRRHQVEKCTQEILGA